MIVLSKLATASVNIAGDAFGGWSGMESCFFG